MKSHAYYTSVLLLEESLFTVDNKISDEGEKLECKRKIRQR